LSIVTTAVWVSLGGIVVVAGFVAGRRWQRRADARHGAWLEQVLADDREVGELEQRLRLAAREQQEHGGE
jgi:hypothetical protein